MQISAYEHEYCVIALRTLKPCTKNRGLDGIAMDRLVVQKMFSAAQQNTTSAITGSFYYFRHLDLSLRDVHLRCGPFFEKNSEDGKMNL